MALRTRPSRAGSLSTGAAGTTNSIGLPAIDTVSMNASSLAGKRSANPFKTLIKKFKSKDDLARAGGNDSDSDLDFECGGLTLEEHEDATYYADLFITNPNPESAPTDSARSDATFTSTSSSPSLSHTDSSAFFSGASSARSSATFSSISSHSYTSDSESNCKSPDRVARHVEPETEEEAVLRRQREDQAAIDALEAYFAMHVKPSAALSPPHPNIDEYGRRASSPNTATTSSSTFVRPSLRNRRSETSLKLAAANPVRYHTSSRRPSVGPVAEHPASPASPTKASFPTSTSASAHSSRQRSYTYAYTSANSSGTATPSASPVTTSPLPYKLNGKRSFSASHHATTSPTSEEQAYSLPSSSILASRAGSRRGSIAHGIVNQPYI